MTVVIVGAGLAGLVCARHLAQQQIDVTVLEAADDVGGRVRSDRVDEYTLDRGFQVLFDQYPAVRRNLNLAALQLRAFEPGAIICQNGRRTVLTDPLRDRTWRDVLEAGKSSAVPLDDKLRTLRLALMLRDRESDERAEPDVQSTEAYLREQGFDERTIDTFFRPFYGGIFLERELTTTAALFRFYFRMLSTGRTTLPAGGIGAITQQLAVPLRAADQIRLNTRVEGLLSDGERVTGVRIEGGAEIEAEAVVLATDAATAQQIAGDDVALRAPNDALGVTTVYFGGAQQLYKSRKIVLNANHDAFVNNAQLLSNVAPNYAPVGRHLLSASVLSVPELDDRQLIKAVMDDLRRMFAGNTRMLAALDSYYPLRIYRIPYAQFSQPPGVYRTLPPNRTDRPGLFVAAEWTAASSINGAMTSGEHCAAAVGRTLRAVREG